MKAPKKAQLEHQPHCNLWFPATMGTAEDHCDCTPFVPGPIVNDGLPMSCRRVYAIRHIPTQAYMPCRMFRTRSGGWSLWNPGPYVDGWGGCDGFDKNPRLFFTLRSAQNALSAWLQGVHTRSTGGSGGFDGDDYWDEITIETPPVPRVRAEMEIIPLLLSGLK